MLRFGEVYQKLMRLTHWAKPRIVKWLCRYTRSEDYGFKVNLGDYKGRTGGAEGCVFESGGGEGVVLLLVSSRGLICRAV